MIEVQIHNQRNELLDTYNKAFKARFGELPILEPDTVTSVFDWAIHKLGFQKAKDLVRAYLRLSDEWIEGQGFPLEIFRKQINKIIVASASKKGINQDLYFVGKSESGTPIYSEDPNTLKGTIAKHWEVILWDEYLKGPETYYK